MRSGRGFEEGGRKTAFSVSARGQQDLHGLVETVRWKAEPRLPAACEMRSCSDSASREIPNEAGVYARGLSKRRDFDQVVGLDLAMWTFLNATEFGHERTFVIEHFQGKLDRELTFRHLVAQVPVHALCVACPCDEPFQSLELHCFRLVARLEI